MKASKTSAPEAKKNSKPSLDLTYFLAYFGEAMLLRQVHGGERIFLGKLKK